MRVDKKHFLRVLLRLIVLDFGLFVGGVNMFGPSGNYEIRLVVMGVGACAGAVGLGVLVRFARVSGGDLTSVSLGLKV